MITKDRVLAVDGVLPAQLTGVFLQASAHPAGGGERRQILSGIEIADGTARLYRAPHAPAEALPGLTAALPDAGRYRIVLDLPLVCRRAAALLGVADPYTWQRNRPARVGLVPAEGDATLWFTVENCYVSRLVNAYEHDNLVILEGIRHARPDRPGHLCRWELDPSSGTARSRRLTEATDLATVDGRWSGRRHRQVFTVANGRFNQVTLAHHDLSTWGTVERPLGIGLRAGQPVFVPKGSTEGDGWLLVLVEDPVHRCATLLVLDAMDIAGRPVAQVNIPLPMSASWQASWLVR